MSLDVCNDDVHELIADELRNFKEAILNQLHDDEDEMCSEHGSVFLDTEGLLEEFESTEEIYADKIIKGINDVMIEMSLEVQRV